MQLTPAQSTHAEQSQQPTPTGGQQDPGYPKDTPLAEMTTEQQVAYWKHQSRKHEQVAKARGDYDQVKAELGKLRQASMTDQEKAIEAARAEAADEARAEERERLLGEVVTAHVSAAMSAAGANQEQIRQVLSPLDPKFFVGAEGKVDTDKVTNFVASLGLTSTKKNWPDMGAGKRGSHSADKSVSAGRDLYKQMHPKS